MTNDSTFKKKIDLVKRAKGPFSASDLLLNPDGSVYHLDMKPEDLADDIILVGDPGRAYEISKSYLNPDSIIFNHEHRGLRVVTGKVKDTGLPVSVVTSGMGTPSLEIVVNEIYALKEIDFQLRKLKPEKLRNKQINIIRVGTSGGLQESTELGTAVIAEYAMGLDATGPHYDIPHPDDISKLLEINLNGALTAATPDNARFKGWIKAYAAKADPYLAKTMMEVAKSQGVPYISGITVSNDGFNANQGRKIAVPPTIPDIDRVIANTDSGFPNLKFENMEMEASFLLHFANAFRNYRAGAICVAIANRDRDTFDPNYKKAVEQATGVALETLYRMRNKTA